MNKLAIALLFSAGLAQSTGCIITTSDDPAGFDVSWSLSDGECPAGASAHIFSLEVNSQAAPFQDIYNCIDGRGVTAELPAGDYDVWVEIRDEAGTGIFAQSGAVAAAVNSGVVSVAVPAFPINSGFFGFTWTLTDGSGAITCADAGADGVDIIATLASTSEATVDIFDCTAGQAEASALVGLHTIVVDVLDGEDALGTSQARDESITFGNELVDLGNFDFLFGP